MSTKKISFMIVIITIAIISFPVLADTIDTSYTPTTVSVTQENLFDGNSGLALYIPESMPLTANSETGKYEFNGFISASGIVYNNQKLFITLQDSIIDYTLNENDTKVSGEISFANEDDSSGLIISYDSWQLMTNEMQRRNDLGSFINVPYKSTIKITVEQDEMDYLGQYSTTVIFDITMEEVQMAAGMYKNGAMVASWTEMIENGYISVAGGVLTTNNSLKDCDVNKVVISNEVTKIGDAAFKDCSNLVSVIIPDSVITIGYNVFKECSNLSSLYIPASVKNISYNFLVGCDSLQNIIVDPENSSFCSVDNVLFNKNKTFLIKCANKSITEYTIPNTVTNILCNSFSNCINLEKIQIPYGVTKIDWAAFSNCTSLNSIVIPDSVISLGDNVFSNCLSLKTITISNNIKYIPSSAFTNCSNVKEITIPYGVEGIGQSAFYKCTNLQSIVIPNSITYIYSYAFSGTNLESIIIPLSVTEIASNAFPNQWQFTGTIYCEAASKPDGWNDYWCSGNDERVVWGYTEE